MARSFTAQKSYSKEVSQQRSLARKLRFHKLKLQFLREVLHESFVSTTSACYFWGRSRTKCVFEREREVADHAASMKFTTPQHLQDSAMPCATCGVKGEVMQACNASPVGSDLVCILKRTQFDGAGYVKVRSYVDVTGPLHFQNRTFKPMLWSSITGRALILLRLHGLGAKKWRVVAFG